jgi:hypothetical protein
VSIQQVIRAQSREGIHGNRETKKRGRSKKSKEQESSIRSYCILRHIRRCSSQSRRWCSGPQYLTSLHLLQTRARGGGSRPSPEARLPSLEAESWAMSVSVAGSSSKQTVQSIQLHICRARTRRPPCRPPRFRATTSADGGPRLGKRIISHSSLQHGLGQPEGKSQKMSSEGTNRGWVKKMLEYEAG